MVLLTVSSLWGAMARSTILENHEPKEDTNLEGKYRNTMPIFSPLFFSPDEALIVDKLHFMDKEASDLLSWK